MRDVLAKLFIASFATIALIAAVSSNARPVKAHSASCSPIFRGEWCGLACEWVDPWWCPEWLCGHWDCEDSFFPAGIYPPPGPEPCDATCTNE